MVHRLCKGPQVPWWTHVTITKRGNPRHTPQTQLQAPRLIRLEMMRPICFLLEELPPLWTGSIYPMPVNLLHCRSLQCGGSLASWVIMLGSRLVTSLSSVWFYFTFITKTTRALCWMSSICASTCDSTPQPFLTTFVQMPEMVPFNHKNYNLHSLNGRKLTQGYKELIGIKKWIWHRNLFYTVVENNKYLQDYLQEYPGLSRCTAPYPHSSY